MTAVAEEARSRGTSSSFLRYSASRAIPATAGSKRPMAKIRFRRLVLLLNGRPYSIPSLAANAPAILEGWYLGQEAGPAVARSSSGETQPAALPVTIAAERGPVASLTTTASLGEASLFV